MAQPIVAHPAVLGQIGEPIIVKPPEVNAAHDFAYIGYLLLVLESLPGLIAAAVALFYIPFALYIYGWIDFLTFLVTGAGLPPPFAPFALYPFLSNIQVLLIAIAAVAAVVLLYALIVWAFTVRNVNNGKFEAARKASLFFGIVFLIVALPTFGLSLIPGLFFLLAYAKLGEVVQRYGPIAMTAVTSPVPPVGAAVPAPPPMPAPVAPVAVGPAPIVAGGQIPGLGPPMPYPPAPPGYSQQPLCPNCGQPLYYAQRYRRWYCMHCESTRR